MNIHGFNKSTLLDYPKHLAATIFVASCNMRCPFCHNASLVLRPNTQPIIPTDDVLAYLKKRKNILEGLCITGGEPTLHPSLPSFINEVKKIGLKVKLDTNGTNPTMMKELIDNKLIDYVAMDIKNSKNKYKYTAGNKDIPMIKIEESLSLLLSNIIDYEFRTTIVNELHTKQDMKAIGGWIKGAKAYYLQAYKDSDHVISPGLTSPTKKTLILYKELLSSYVEHVDIRGVD